MNACAAAGNHQALVTLLGKLGDHHQQKEGLIFDLIPSDFTNLGNPPSFITCTRDTFDRDKTFSIDQLISISIKMASVLQHLHSKGIMHGDFYAHNIMIDQDANTLLGDFGAATLYNVSGTYALHHQKLDVRAYGCLLEDILERIHTPENYTGIVNEFIQLKNECMNAKCDLRPTFSVIHEKILRITKSNFYKADV